MNLSTWLVFVFIVKFCVASHAPEEADASENVTSGYVFDENAVLLSALNDQNPSVDAVTTTTATAVIQSRVPLNVNLGLLGVAAGDILLTSLLLVFGGKISGTCRPHLCLVEMGFFIAGYLFLQFFLLFGRIGLIQGNRGLWKSGLFINIMHPIIAFTPLIAYFVDPVAPTFLITARVILGLCIALETITLLALNCS